jgi:hypothetical protein
MQMRRAIGTEPRFLLIVQMLHDIIQNSIDDPEKLLKQLERQRADLDRQINTISFSKHTVTIFLDSDLLVWYHLILSYTFAIFSAILFFRSYRLYHTVPYQVDDHNQKDLQL